MAESERTLVFGTFDRIHAGHLFFLSEAQKSGQLYISVASDQSVLLRKGKSPLQKASARKKELEKLGIAHQVFIGDKNPGKWSPLEKVKPDTIAVGYDQIELLRALKKIQSKYGFKIKKIKEFKGKQLHSSILNQNQELNSKS